MGLFCSYSLQLKCLLFFLISSQHSGALPSLPWDSPSGPVAHTLNVAIDNRPAPLPPIKPENSGNAADGEAEAADEGGDAEGVEEAPPQALVLHPAPPLEKKYARGDQQQQWTLVAGGRRRKQRLSPKASGGFFRKFPLFVDFLRGFDRKNFLEFCGMS